MWAPKNWCFWIVVLTKTVGNSLDNKEVKSVSPKGNQLWIVTGRTDAEAEAPILWPPYVKSWLIEKDPDAGKDWRQEEKGTRGQDGWMASPTRWTWVWASSGRCWRTGKPGVLQSMGSQSIRHDWATEWQQMHTLKEKVIDFCINTRLLAMDFFSGSKMILYIKKPKMFYSSSLRILKKIRRFI